MGQILAATHTHAKSSPSGAVCTPLPPPPPPSSGTGLAMSDEGGRNTSWGKGGGISGAGLQGSGKESRKETSFFSGSRLSIVICLVARVKA